MVSSFDMLNEDSGIGESVSRTGVELDVDGVGLYFLHSEIRTRNIVEKHIRSLSEPFEQPV